MTVALETCKACGKQIATTAKECPGCGHRPARNSAVKVAIVLVLALAAVGGGKLYIDKMATDRRAAF